MSLKGLKRIFYTFGLVALCTALFSFAGVANALDIVLEPSVKQREIGDQVRVQIYADSAVDIISMGVKVSFDPAILQVVSASKYEDLSTNDGWVMDADGDPLTPTDQYTDPPVEIDNVSGTVMIIGGRLVGNDPSNSGLSDKVLLGSIVFTAIANGTSNLNVDLAKYHSNHPTDTFDNFVQIDGTVTEPGNVPGPPALGTICVVDDACKGDLNNDGGVNFADLAEMKANFFTDCSTLPPWEVCVGDVNNDGFVNFADLALMKENFFREDCLCN
jgi:hypothetical protein